MLLPVPYKNTHGSRRGHFNNVYIPSYIPIPSYPGYMANYNSYVPLSLYSLFIGYLSANIFPYGILISRVSLSFFVNRFSFTPCPFLCYACMVEGAGAGIECTSLAGFGLLGIFRIILLTSWHHLVPGKQPAWARVHNGSWRLSFW